MQQRDYEAFDAYSRQAWANEARVYPQAQQTANDVVQGVIFYLFLLIPFAYFLERLLFGYSDLKRQLGAAFGIFLVIFLHLLADPPGVQHRLGQSADYFDRVCDAGPVGDCLAAGLGQV